MKILGIDFGTKRIGLALSDETQTLARELKIVSPREFWEQVDDLVEAEEVTQIVVGLPLNMNGERTDKTEEVQQFADQLQKQVHIPISFADERLSSSMAEHISGSATHIDSLAAQIFLQNYLNQNKQ